MDLLCGSGFVSRARQCPQRFAGLGGVAGVDRREYLPHVGLELRLGRAIAFAVAEILLVSLLGAGRVWHAGYYPLKVGETKTG